MKKLAIVNSENIEIVETIKSCFDCDIVQSGDDLTGYEIIILTGYDTNLNDIPDEVKVLNLHPALLPSFAVSDALKESFLSGVKVGGITIHEVTKDKFFSKILAQYPVLIGLNTHFDEYEAEITACAKKLYPAVIDAVMNDRVFDFADIFKTSCHKVSCGTCNNSCAGCRKS